MNTKEWKEAHKDRVREIGRAYRAKNKGKFTVYERGRVRVRNSDYFFRKNLRRHYGITAKDYDTMLNKQGGKCAICGKQRGKRRLAVDHDHETGKLRGLLCGNCNQAIGKFRDDIGILLKAIQYLEASKGKNYYEFDDV